MGLGRGKGETRPARTYCALANSRS
jgi:hypothetical protein